VKADLERALAWVETGERFLVASHMRPDGDAVGSLLGMTLSLQMRGKQAWPVLADGVPQRFRFLPGAEMVLPRLEVPYDGVILVDCSDPERSGIMDQLQGRSIDMNIDHHPTNTHFADINLVREDAAATAEILYDLSAPLRLPLGTEVATNLLAGLVTDTIGFRTQNVTARVLRVAADLVELGAPLAEIYQRTLNHRSFTAAQYWGQGLSQLERSDQLVWASLTADDRARVGYHGNDDADLINLLSTIEGAMVSIIFVEQPGGVVKVSWRSQSAVDVARIAENFGGGGHHEAAGAMIAGDLEEVHDQVLKATKGALALVEEGAV
jgi:phosphoesterase RecJ-like protein